jgi:hypothetical protein
VKIDGPLSYPKWIESLRKGRSFVTNGPMLEFTGNGRFLGETLRFEKETRVLAKAQAVSLFPLKTVELVYNGSVVATGRLSSDRLSGSIDEDVTANRSGWLSVRALGERGEQAHTSPIYVEVSGKPTRSKEDAEYFLHWIDRLEAKLNTRQRLPNSEIAQRVESQINAARAVYSAIVASSRE